MALNTVTCGNCGTVNDKDEDFCVECGQPLTASGDESVRATDAAADDSSLIGGHSSAIPGVAGAGGFGAIGMPAVTDAATERGGPTSGA